MSGAQATDYPRRFVGIDLETTGVDPRKDSIIEVAAVRVVDGELQETYESLIDPGCPIPSDVVYLTGITDDDVKGAPRIGDVLPDVMSFIGSDPVVAHHAPFDLAFLNAAAGGDPEHVADRGDVFDTLILARALMPRLPNHRLATLVEFFGIDVARSHRAGDDARAVSALLLKFLAVLDQVGGAILSRMGSLADPRVTKLIEIARRRADERGTDPFGLPDFGPKSDEFLRYDNVRGSGVRRSGVEERVDLDLDELETLFGKNGPVAARLPGYEERREQLDMMRAVGDSLNSSVHLVVEAGTGVGKSLAYLVPAAYYAVRNGERIIVSTNTKNLQEQLFNKDVPFLESSLDIDFSVALLKGRSNYLCHRRWRQVLEGGLSPEERAEFLPIVLWEEETRSGDIGENAGFRRRGYLWSRISADGGPCLGQACPFHDRCYLMQARRSAQTAHVVIVNHSLLFSDTEADNRILGDYAYAICDEAHNIEQSATEHLGKRASAWRARSILDSLYRKDRVASGVVADLEEALATSEDAGILSAIKVASDRLARCVEAAAGSSEAFFDALAKRHPELNRGKPVEYGKLRYRSDCSVASLLAAEFGAALDGLAAVADEAEGLADLVVDSGIERTEAIVQGLVFHGGRARELAIDLEHLASASDEGSVFWLEVRFYRDVLECTLKSAPVSIAERMGDFLYSRVDSLVMTSATLTVDGSFNFMLERLGLDLLPDWKVLPLNVGSPYDYNAQSLAVVAGYLQTPSSGGFNASVSDLVIKLASRRDGGMLVLFTSRSALDSVFKSVRDPLTARGKQVLAQGHGPSASALLGQFSRDVDSILLATSSFWEGVDVPGRSLELLVVVKLPFPVPRDPIVEAHCERYDAEGEDSFNHYMVPRTAIRLRQGFGRLIRSTSDTGVVVFLDSRLRTRAYGARLLEQLPTESIIAETEAELLAAVGSTLAERAIR